MISDTNVLLHKRLEETVIIMISCSFEVIIFSGGGYGDITSLPMPPLSQSNDSILSDIDMVL